MVLDGNVIVLESRLSIFIVNYQKIFIATWSTTQTEMDLLVLDLVYNNFTVFLMCTQRQVCCRGQLCVFYEAEAAVQ